MLRSALRGHTTEVLEEEDARSIVAVARDHAPDLILLDVLMPGVDGSEATRALRADEHTRDIPVYMLSALDDTKNIQRAMTAGATGYLTKTSDIGCQLTDVITKLVSASRAPRR